MKLDAPLELLQPVVIPFVGGIVIQDDVDLPVLRLIGQHAIQEAAEVLPLLIYSVNFVLTWPVPTSRAANRFSVPWRL